MSGISTDKDTQESRSAAPFAQEISSSDHSHEAGNYLSVCASLSDPHNLSFHATSWVAKQDRVVHCPSSKRWKFFHAGLACAFMNVSRRWKSLVSSNSHVRSSHNSVHASSKSLLNRCKLRVIRRQNPLFLPGGTSSNPRYWQ